MPKSLTKTQIAQYDEAGYLAPIPVMVEDEALALRQKLEAIEAEMGGPLRGDLRHKTHLLFPFLGGLVRHPRILDAIEDVLGPDILCWSSNFFIKEATDPAFVSWHQDSTYWGLSSPDVATAWVALTHRIRLSGRYIPSSIRQREDEDSATLRHGEVRFHNFEHEPRPRNDTEPALLQLHRQISTRNANVLYRGTGFTCFNGHAARR